MRESFDYSLPTFMDLAGPEVTAMIWDCSDVKSYKAGTVIEERGSPASHFHVIESGLVQLGIDSRKGTRFNLTRLGPGHTFGETAFFLGQPTLHEARADTDVTLLKLGGEAVDALMERSVPFSKALLSVACLRVQVTLTHIGDAAKMPLKQRVAKWLIRNSEPAEVNAGGTPVRIAMRQIDLANALGVSRVSIGKTLKALSEEGCIKIGYGELVVTDRQALSAKILIR